MFRNNKYNTIIKSTWDDTQTSSLKRENYNLTLEIAQLKKKYDLIKKEKKDLENGLFKMKQHYHTIPRDIEILLDKISDITFKQELHSKIKNLVSCTTCIVCHERMKRVVYIECRHLVSCIECNKNLGNNCPLCRQNSKKLVLY